MQGGETQLRERERELKENSCRFVQSAKSFVYEHGVVGRGGDAYLVGTVLDLA